MKRLVEVTVIDGETFTYRLPSGHIEGVFDGDVMLEPSRYQVDAIDGRLRLKAAPAFAVRALMWIDEGAHRTRFVPSMETAKVLAELVNRTAEAIRKREGQWVDDLPLENAAQPKDGSVARMLATGFTSILRELQDLKREVAMICAETRESSVELKRANSR